MTYLPPCGQLDYETPLYKGCGSSELFTVTLVVGCLWLPLALIFGYVLLNGSHALYFAFATFTVGTISSVAAIANIKHVLISGKPETWYTQKIFCTIHPAFSSTLVYKSGGWSSQRSG